MTAPDRIWLEVENDFISHPGHAWIRQYEDDYVEYIRRDAFPVEEIRRAYKNRVAFDKHNDLLRRVLSLLEQEEGNE